jgi:hypothetical protein
MAVDLHNRSICCAPIHHQGFLFGRLLRKRSSRKHQRQRNNRKKAKTGKLVHNFIDEVVP